MVRESPALMALAVAAGAFDALSYLGLHGVFPANMTGNTVVLAVSLARHSGREAVRAGTALGGFAAGVAAGTWLIPRRHRVWPASVVRSLGLEVAAVLALLIWWHSTGVAGVRLWLIVLAAGAMGIQSAAVHASHVGGVTTTYMTGTYMNAVVRATNRLRGAAVPGREDAAPNLPGAAWIVYVGGALAGGVAEHAWGAWAVLIPLALIGAVTVRAATRPRQER